MSLRALSFSVIASEAWQSPGIAGPVSHGEREIPHQRLLRHRESQRKGFLHASNPPPRLLRLVPSLRSGPASQRHEGGCNCEVRFLGPKQSHLPYIPLLDSSCHCERSVAISFPLTGEDSGEGDIPLLLTPSRQGREDQEES